MTKYHEIGASYSPPDDEAHGPAIDPGRRLVVVNSEGRPLQVMGSLTADPLGAGACIDLATVTNTQAIAATSARIVQDIVPGDYYYFIAVGNSAYIRGSGPTTGSTPTAIPTATTEAGVGYSLLVPEGACLGPFRIGDRYLAVIGASAAGTITVLHVTPAANPK